jgi:hypothetical protein
MSATTASAEERRCGGAPGSRCSVSRLGRGWLAHGCQHLRRHQHRVIAVRLAVARTAPTTSPRPKTLIGPADMSQEASGDRCGSHWTDGRKVPSHPSSRSMMRVARGRRLPPPDPQQTAPPVQPLRRRAEVDQPVSSRPRRPQLTLASLVEAHEPDRLPQRAGLATETASRRRTSRARRRPARGCRRQAGSRPGAAYHPPGRGNAEGAPGRARRPFARCAPAG